MLGRPLRHQLATTLEQVATAVAGPDVIAVDVRQSKFADLASVPGTWRPSPGKSFSSRGARSRCRSPGTVWKSCCRSTCGRSATETPGRHRRTAARFIENFNGPGTAARDAGGPSSYGRRAPSMSRIRSRSPPVGHPGPPPTGLRSGPETRRQARSRGMRPRREIFSTTAPTSAYGSARW